MWTMFTPVQEVMPLNCSRDVSAAIDYMDGVFKTGSRAEAEKLKAKFKLDGLTDADFGQAIENGPWLWQSTQFYTANKDLGGSGVNQFHRFCDYVEGVPPNSTAAVPGEEGVGVTKAVEGYAQWFTESFLPGQCESYGYPEWQGTYNTGCYQNQNASNPQYRDLSYDNPVNRQWNWMLCNEPFGWWQNGAPEGRPSIVSRFVNNKYWTDQCELWFPGGAYGFAQGKTEADLNAWTGGWSELDIPRLMYANGQYDTWREVTVSSSVRPGGPMQSSADANNGTQVRVLAGGVHCSDLYGPNWEANEGARKIADDQTAQMAEWVEEFYATKGRAR